MISKRKKNKRSFFSFLSSILTTLFLLGSIIVLVFFNIKINQKRLKILSQIETLEKEIVDLEEEKSELKTEISQADKESYWEARAREQGYVREGEQQVVVVPPESSSPEEQEESSIQSLFGQFLQTIKNFLRQ